MITNRILRISTRTKLKPLSSLHLLHGMREMRSVKTTKSFDLSGIYPPIPTPFSDNEDVNWDALKRNLLKWEEIPFRGKESDYIRIKK